MEEKKKVIYLEDAEEITGQKLDRYGLTSKQSKQYKKSGNTKNIKKIVIISIWLVLGILTGVILFLLKDSLLFDDTQRKNMNIFMCLITGICWWGLLVLIFLKPINMLLAKISEKIKKKAGEVGEFEPLPFTQPNGSPEHSNHKDFIRCPICGHKLEVIDSYSNEGKIYEINNEGGTSSDLVAQIDEATPLEEYTSYRCYHCTFSFKACYKAEYKYDLQAADNAKCTVVHTNEIVPLNDNVKLDSEAKKILKPYIGTKITLINKK
ncbi:MAG: hypothetical protein IJ008_04465 [Clostridia bacterium]|nr:hypothetical protein [Clostridia bacterium]